MIRISDIELPIERSTDKVPVTVFSFHDDNGIELTFDMYGFMQNAYINRIMSDEEFEEMKEFRGELMIIEDVPADSITTGNTNVFMPLGDERMTINEIVQWLYDILYDRWKAEHPEEASLVKTENPMYEMFDMIQGLSSKRSVAMKTKDTYFIICCPNEYVTIMEQANASFLSFWTENTQPKSITIIIPTIWNETQNCANVFKNRDRCRVRFVKGRGDIEAVRRYNRMEELNSWDDFIVKVWER